jgi:hypothetical protein
MAKQKIGLGSRTEREKMKSYEDDDVFVQANEQQMCVLRERERACVRVEGMWRKGRSILLHSRSWSVSCTSLCSSSDNGMKLLLNRRRGGACHWCWLLLLRLLRRRSSSVGTTARHGFVLIPFKVHGGHLAIKVLA